VPRTTRTTQREEALLAHQASLRGAQVLLVEDNPINREIALSVLGSAGIAVSVACDGREALQMLAQQRFDGVLMDCQMPVMDGYAATRALRREPQWRELPVIAMTANALVGDREKVLAAGMNDHVAKPIKVDELFATLARWIHPADAAPDASNGIDRTAGIAATMGDEDLYRRLMRMFRDRETDFPERFRAARAAGDTATAMRMAHDLKNVAGTLAVRAVHLAATELERACIDELDDGCVEPLVRKVARLLRPVMAELREPDDQRIG
jgi:CheY-like chemotaxis protein